MKKLIAILVVMVFGCTQNEPHKTVIWPGWGEACVQYDAGTTCIADLSGEWDVGVCVDIGDSSAAEMTCMPRCSEDEDGDFGCPRLGCPVNPNTVDCYCTPC